LSLTALQPFNLSTHYAYDNASRLASVGDGTNTTTYAYLANSALIEHLAFLQASTTRMTTTNRYDYLNRLTGVASVPSADAAVSFDYAYNDANQRVAVTNADSSRWSWGYDSLGQVTSGKRYWSDSTVVAGQQFEYAFDSIGNRTSASSGGSQFGTSLRTATYAANLLNQYTNRTVPGYVEVQGSANSSAIVTVNNEATYRKGSYYRKELSVASSSAAVWQGITNIAVLNNGGTNGEDIVTTKTGNVLVPKTPEAFSYDADGNMTQDGKWVYAWDAENRLVSMTSLTNLPSASRLKLDFAYDNKWRRIQKIVSAWNGSAYVPQSTNRFLYDGWNLVAMLDGSGTLLQSFRWGTDLSGSQQGAGGVGGLKAMTVHTGTNASTYFYAFDGNGNVMALVNAATGGKAAEYEYGPFGELLRASGPLAALNTFRFSTKFCDEESGFYYYGYRFYDPSTGRWQNRDQLDEPGFMSTLKRLGSSGSEDINLYLFVSNSPLDKIDPDGRFGWACVGAGFTAGCLIGTIQDHIKSLGKCLAIIRFTVCASCSWNTTAIELGCAIYSSPQDYKKCVCDTMKSSSSWNATCNACLFPISAFLDIGKNLGCN
jgi:RHS repeat-associated protein